MPDGTDRDRLRPLLDSIEKDIFTEHQASLVGFHLITEWPSHSRKFGKNLHAVKKIVNYATSDSLLLSEEVEDLLNPLQGGFRPDDPVGQLLVPCQEAGSCLFMRHDSAGFDIGKSPIEILEKLHLVEQRPVAFDIH